MKEKYHFIYIAIILLFAGTTIWWVDHSNKHDNAAEHYVQHVKDYPLLDPALPFYDKKDLIVNIQGIRSYLKALPEQNKDWADMSIYLELLNTGSNVTVNQDSKIWPASLAKLPVGMIAMKKVESGEWDLQNTKLTLVKEDADIAYTPAIANEIGKSFSIELLLEKLLLESDNTAYHMLVRELSEEELISIAEAVGLEEFFRADGKVSAKDYTRLLRALYSSTYLNEERSQKLLSLLQRSKFDRFIRAGIPKEVKFAHKWGINENENVYADSGIVYLKNRPYLLSVIISGKTDDQKADQAKAEELIKDIGKRTYEYIKNQ
jgi:beta-lactamase class A